VSKGPDLEAIREALAAPFEPHEVRFMPWAVRGTRALALPYVDVRVVEDRLDRVLGAAGWQDAYRFVGGGLVLCRLRCFLGGRWLARSDVGCGGGQGREGDRYKAAVGDALRRAAVKFGVGRYLYRLPRQWVDFDPQTQRFLRPPGLPASAPLPGASPAGSSSQGVGAGAAVHGEQLEHLLRLLSAKGYSARKLAARYGVAALALLTDAQYAHAAAALAVLPDRVRP
jgi:hypothetical protein